MNVLVLPALMLLVGVLILVFAINLTRRRIKRTETDRDDSATDRAVQAHEEAQGLRMRLEQEAKKRSGEPYSEEDWRKFYERERGRQRKHKDGR